MCFKFFCSLLVILYCIDQTLEHSGLDTKLTKVWGPGLSPHIIVMPARYFFIQAVDKQNSSIFTEKDLEFVVNLEGFSKAGKSCRIWKNVLNRKDGSFIVRYKVYEPCFNLQITVKYQHNQVANSPYMIPQVVYPDDCDCPNQDVDQFLNTWNCGGASKQIFNDLEAFKKVDWDQVRGQVVEKYDQPHSISLCHYILKNNSIYRTCYGKYVGFKMFMDSILLSLSRKIILPDMEFFVNLGDWPLAKKNSDKLPIFSWCGNNLTHDIIMPTYDITESTLENMGRVMLDMLSVQGNVKFPWEERIEKAFWRGRDSNQHRLDLIDIAKDHPELFNVSLTNFFFFRDKQETHGPKTEHVSFFSFFDYKYQLGIDGTVAAYRFPYLLAGGSLIFKQESQYYEHFYDDLIPNTHFVPVKRDLSDLVEKIKWAIHNDNEAHRIALNGQEFANNNLLPQNIFCYYANLLNEFSKRIVSKINVQENMEKVQQIAQPQYCDCKSTIKDEL